MNINRIICEEIDRFLVEKKGKSSKKSDKKSKSSKKSSKNSSKSDKKSDKKGNKSDKKGKKSPIRKNAIKDRNGWRKDFDYEKYNTENGELNDADNEKLADRLDDPVLNIAALGRIIYPHHTKQGAQSQLRKKIEHEKSDSGSVYKFRRIEARKLNNELSKIGR